MAVADGKGEENEGNQRLDAAGQNKRKLKAKKKGRKGFGVKHLFCSIKRLIQDLVCSVVDWVGRGFEKPPYVLEEGLSERRSNRRQECREIR